MVEKKKIELHPKPKQTVEINRPLVLTVSIVVVTILLLAIVGALTTTKKAKPADSVIETKIKTDKPSAVSPELKGLPKDYSDIDVIKKYLPTAENAQFALLMQKFSDLQNEYVLLKQQLSQKDITPSELPLDPKTLQARKSGLVFGGIGSQAEDVLGKKAKLSKKDEGLVPTKAQAELIKQENADARKLAVLKGKDKPEDIYDMHNVIKPVSKYQIQAGTLIPSTLITAINTTHPGTLIAQVRSNIYDTVTGKFLLVPKGSKLLGQYKSRVTPGQSRVLLAFDRLVRPDGSSILLGRPLGVDAIGQSGIAGNVDNHWARIIGASTISTILNVGVGIASDSTADPNYYHENSKQKAFRGGAQSISNVGQKITDRAIQIKPTITLPPGHQFNVAVKKDMVLTPYKPRR